MKTALLFLFVCLRTVFNISSQIYNNLLEIQSRSLHLDCLNTNKKNPMSSILELTTENNKKTCLLKTTIIHIKIKCKSFVPVKKIPY